MTVYIEPTDVDDLIASVGFHVRDRNLLLSALAAPLPVFGEEVHLGLYNKAAALLIAINGWRKPKDALSPTDARRCFT